MITIKIKKFEVQLDDNGIVNFDDFFDLYRNNLSPILTNLDFTKVEEIRKKIKLYIAEGYPAMVEKINTIACSWGYSNKVRTIFLAFHLLCRNPLIADFASKHERASKAIHRYLEASNMKDIKNIEEDYNLDAKDFYGFLKVNPKLMHFQTYFDRTEFNTIQKLSEIMDDDEIDYFTDKIVEKGATATNLSEAIVYHKVMKLNCKLITFIDYVLGFAEQEGITISNSISSIKNYFNTMEDDELLNVDFSKILKTKVIKLSILKTTEFYTEHKEDFERILTSPTVDNFKAYADKFPEYKGRFHY